MLRLFVEAETGENAGRPCGSAVGIDNIEPFVNLADVMVVGCVLGLGQELCAFPSAFGYSFQLRGEGRLCGR